MVAQIIDYKNISMNLKYQLKNIFFNKLMENI